MRIVLLPATPESKGTASVSHDSTRTDSNVVPSYSAMIWLMIVWVPEPCSKIGVRT